MKFKKGHLLVYWFIGLLVYWFIYAPVARPVYAAWIEECSPPSFLEKLVGKIFNRLPFRPFPFKSCQNKKPTGDICEAGMELVKTFELPRADPILGDPACNPEKPKPGQRVTCERNIDSTAPVIIDLSQAELPLDVTCPDGEETECYKDTLSDSKKMNYLQSWLSGIFQEAEMGPAETETNAQQQKFITNSGAIKKLIPNLNEYKSEVAKAAAEEKIYDQRVCYVKNGKVISRKEAEGGYDIFYSLKDFVLMGKLNPKPGDEPWYTCWLQSQLTQTADLLGKLSLGTISTSLNIPQVLQINKETDLFSQAFIPEEAEGKLITEGDPCDPKKAVRFAQRGDKFIEGKTITVNVVLKKKVEYTYRELTAEELEFYEVNGVPPPTTVEVEVTFPIPMKLQVPEEAGILSEKLAEIAQAKVPTSIKNTSLEVPVGAACAGANCSVSGGLAFPKVGSGINSANVLGKCALNPLYQGPECQIESTTSDLACSTSELPNIEPDGSCQLCNNNSIVSMIDDNSVNSGGLPPTMVKILERAGQEFNVPPGLMLGIMYHEGAFSQNRYQWTEENVQKWSFCGEKMPQCNDDPNNGTGQMPFGFIPSWFYKGDNEYAQWWAVRKIDPSRNSRDKVSPCNFLDATFALAQTLHTWYGSHEGSYNAPLNTCYGYPLTNDHVNPSACGKSTWKDPRVVQARIGHSGYCSGPENNSPFPASEDVSRALNWFHALGCQ